MEYLIDQRGQCLSVMCTVRYPDYEHLINRAYHNRGGIEGQRGALKSSSAMRIRRRMIDDITKGTVLPPVVVGAAIPNVNFNEFKDKTDQELIKWLNENAEDLSLIDGMQRTTAMMEAAKVADLSQYKIRVELWISGNINSLIYRMLVLNSGQVPWNIKRQLETVFSSVLKQLQTDLPDLEFFALDDSRRRRSAKQYQATNVLEMYLVFGSRKEKIDIKERLSDEFVRLDFMDLTSTNDSTEKFTLALKLMARLDALFSKVAVGPEQEKERFLNGVDIFSSQPACIGFIVSTAILMLGRPGNTRTQEELDSKWFEYRATFERLLDKLEGMPAEELQQYLALPTLSEKLATKKSTKVGDFEREFFKTAFTTLYEEGEYLSSFEVCWNAY